MKFTNAYIINNVYDYKTMQQEKLLQHEYINNTYDEIWDKSDKNYQQWYYSQYKSTQLFEDINDAFKNNFDVRFDSYVNEQLSHNIIKSVGQSLKELEHRLNCII